MRSPSFTTRVGAAVGVAFTALALAGAAGAAGSTLFAIATLLTDHSGQSITLVARRSPVEPMPTRTVLSRANMPGPVQR